MNLKKIRTGKLLAFIAFVFMNSCVSTTNGDISHIWLTFQTETPSQITINWESPEPGNSEVHLKLGVKEIFTTRKNENLTIHHIKVPLNEHDVEYKYMVKTGNQSSEWHSFQGMPSKDSLRVIIIANWGFAVNPDMSKILDEKPHLLLTCGDNIPGLFNYGEEGDNKCIKSYLKLIDSYPALFQSVPFMPALGNHDKQLYPRGKKAPDNYMLYDTNAVAFRSFFELPGDEWKWAFELPDYHIRFLALDLNHIGDYGTNWQTCHAYNAQSDQFLWFQNEVNTNSGKFLVTINNSDNPHIRRIANGIWKDELEKSSVVITGSGYYAEKSVPFNTPYLNTSLIAGNVYADSLALKTESLSTYVLLKIFEEELSISIKTFTGELFDKTVIRDIK